MCHRLPKAAPSRAGQCPPLAAPLRVVGHPGIGGCRAAGLCLERTDRRCSGHATGTGGDPRAPAARPALLTFVSLILTAMTCLRWRMISMSSSHSSISLASCMAVFTCPGTAKAHAVSRDTRVPEPGSPAALQLALGETQYVSPMPGPGSAAARGWAGQEVTALQHGQQRAGSPAATAAPPEDRKHAYKYLQGGGQEDGARLFPVVPSDRTRGNGHKLKQRKLHLNMRKNFFPLRVTEPWPRLPREAVESPSLDVVLCSLLWVTLLRQGVGLDDPQKSLPTLTIV